MECGNDSLKAEWKKEKDLEKKKEFQKMKVEKYKKGLLKKKKKIPWLNFQLV